jgi:uncharacterized membrane protein
MNYTADPHWPWSQLWAYLASAPAAVIATLIVAGAGAIVLPIAAYHRGVSGWRVLIRGALLILAVLLGGALLGTLGTSSGLGTGILGVGLALLIVVPLALIGLTIWTYLGAPGATRRRIAVVLTLRLLAFVVVLFLIARPSVGFPDQSQVRNLVMIGLDASRSMSIGDEQGGLSRWELAVQQLEKSQPILERLREEQQTDVLIVRFGDKIAEILPSDPGEPDGKRTEIGRWLREMYERREGNRPPRAFLLFTDGADHGDIPAQNEAARWQSLHCFLYPFACGKPNLGDRQNDIALTSITTDPAPVPVKGKLLVKLHVDAPGFENTTVRLRLFINDKEVKAQDEALPLTIGNPVEIECNAPAEPGEFKVRVVAEDPARRGQPPPGDLVPSNNTIETFATAIKGGISVLYVDKRRGFEPKQICAALDRDSRISRKTVYLGDDRRVDPNLFELDKQYDVIIFGDITAAQVNAIQPKALEEIANQVKAGAGFLMLGGYNTFDNGDWKGTPIEALIPVELTGSHPGQIEDEVKMVPAPDGLNSYVMRIDDAKDVKAAWESLPTLEGISRLGKVKEGFSKSAILARAAGRDDLILVTGEVSDPKKAGGTVGRTMAFAGDTTHRWIRTPETAVMQSRFWRRIVIWLAHQEDAEGSVWVKPDTRRLPVRGELGFSVGVRSKGGVDLPGGTYTVAVVTPAGERIPVPTATTPTDTRGIFARTEAPGEYRIEVHGEATDTTTGEVVRGETAARFLVFDEDLEMTRRAADQEFLRKLATSGGGEFHRAEELPAFLQQLLNNPLARVKPKMVLYPDWRAPGRSPYLWWILGAFVGLLCTEWGLRRKWGMA